jgi:hypothetical protein
MSFSFFNIKKKGTIELSLTFIIGLVLGIVVFSFGLIFAYKLFAGAGKLIETVPGGFEIAEKDCINRQQKVCVPETSKTVKSSQQANFGYIINNNYGENKRFKINVKFAKGILEDGTDAPSQDVTKWTLQDFRVKDIDNGKHYTGGIPFQVPAGTKSGTYAFNINVCFDGTDTSPKCSGLPSLYAPTQQITIEVQ